MDLATFKLLAQFSPRLLAMEPGRERSFDRDWQFFRGEATGAEAPSFDDSGWRSLDVPHDWSAPGQLTAVASKAGREIGRKTFTTVGAPAALRLATDAHHLSNNRNDLADVLVEVVDAVGRVVPDAVQHVKLTVDGEATLAGIANANPHDVDSFQRGDCFTYHGRALGIVRPTGSLAVSSSTHPLRV